jgi:hypothetical protein
VTFGRENDRHVGDCAGSRLKPRGCLACRQSPYAHACDLDASGDPGRGSGKRQAEYNPTEDDDSYEREQTLNEQPA